MLETQVQIKIFQKFIHKITYIWFINLLMDSQTFHCLFHFIINDNKEQTLKYSQDSSLISRSLVSSLKFSVFLIFLWWIFHVPFFFSSSFHVLRGISVSVISEKNVKHTSNCSNSYVHMKHIILHCFQNSKKNNMKMCCVSELSSHFDLIKLLYVCETFCLALNFSQVYRIN